MIIEISIETKIKYFFSISKENLYILLVCLFVLFYFFETMTYASGLPNNKTLGSVLILRINRPQRIFLHKLNLCTSNHRNRFRNGCVIFSSSLYIITVRAILRLRIN